MKKDGHCLEVELKNLQDLIAKTETAAATDTERTE